MNSHAPLPKSQKHFFFNASFMFQSEHSQVISLVYFLKGQVKTSILHYWMSLESYSRTIEVHHCCVSRRPVGWSVIPSLWLVRSSIMYCRCLVLVVGVGWESIYSSLTVSGVNHQAAAQHVLTYSCVCTCGFILLRVITAFSVVYEV